MAEPRPTLRQLRERARELNIPGRSKLRTAEELSTAIAAATTTAEQRPRPGVEFGALLPELRTEILLHSDPADITKLCQTSREWRRVCGPDYDPLWREIVHRRFRLSRTYATRAEFEAANGPYGSWFAVYRILAVRAAERKFAPNWRHLRPVRPLEESFVAVRAKFEAGARPKDALVDAAKDGHTAVVRWLLERLGALESDDVGLPISYAAENGHSEVLGLLLGVAARPIHPRSLTYALISTLATGNLALARILLRHGARLSEEDLHSLSWDVRHTPRARWTINTTRFLLEVGLAPDALLASVAEVGDAESVRLLFESGAEPTTDNAIDALLYALGRRAPANDAVTLAFLDAGVHPGKYVWPNTRPPPSAEVVRALLRVGWRDSKGRMLVATAQRGWSDVMRELLAQRVSPADRNRALHSAVASGQIASVRMLLSAGANPRDDSNTALKAALQARHVDIVELLLRAGADPDALS